MVKKTLRLLSNRSTISVNENTHYIARSEEPCRPIPALNQEVGALETSMPNMPIVEVIPGDEYLSDTEVYLKDRYDLRRNLITDTPEVRVKGTNKYLEVSDVVANSIVRNAQKAHIKLTKQELWNLLASDFTPSYDPIQEYSDSLSDWDEGDPDYIQQLADTVKVSEESLQYWNAWLRKWLVATYACALYPEVVNHTVLILTGAQDIGKTTWLRRLVPERLMRYYYSGVINPSNKDSLIHCAERFIINMDEMGGFLESKSEEFKALITNNGVSIRRPYNRRVENMPRRASFVGSSNKSQFLHDCTGNRRFLVFQALEIDHAHNVDMDGIWAQAKYLYISNFEYWFNGDEVKQVNEQNDRFKSMSIAQEIIQQLFEPCVVNEKPDISLPTTQLLEYILENNSFAKRLTANQLGKGLRSSGYEPRKSNGMQLWDLKYRKKLED